MKLKIDGLLRSTGTRPTVSIYNAAIKIFFTAPSCVPATPFENSGAKLGVKDVAKLMARPEFVAMGEMMNYPGVIPEVKGKIEATLALGKPIDGHAPALSGKYLKTYISAGISTDHEATTLSEAQEKIALGMKIHIREGSSAKDLHDMLPLLKLHPESVMFCSDDLLEGHINVMVREAIKCGYDLFDVLRAASLNAVVHYNLPVGLLREGDSDDSIIVKDLRYFEVIPKVSAIKKQHTAPINNFVVQYIKQSQIATSVTEGDAIKITDGSIITKRIHAKYSAQNDICKIIVVNRYAEHPQPAVGFVQGMGITHGAIATTISHDSHNIIATGSDDTLITKVINEVIRIKGGIAVCNNKGLFSIPLAVGGIMTDKTAEQFAERYREIEQMAAETETILSSPITTLSFMALVVIPEIKITDKGVFDSVNFKFL